jgi:hypothetical protein
MYCYLFKANYNELPREASIISFINIKDGVFKLDTGNFSLEETVEMFPEIIQNILEQMYDKSIDFEHNSKSFVSFCAYC